MATSAPAIQCAIQWFGDAWRGPSFRSQPQCMEVAPPVGHPCMRCEVPIVQEDAGIIVPGFGGATAAWHLACFCRSAKGEEWPAKTALTTRAALMSAVDGELDRLARVERVAARMGSTLAAVMVDDAFRRALGTRSAPPTSRW